MRQYIDFKYTKNLRGRLFKNEYLSQYTSWRVGGIAEYIYIPYDIDDLSYFLSILPLKEKIFWLGHGTNVLVSDKGFKGTIILIKNTLKRLLNESFIYAEAGVSSTELAYFAVNLNLIGFEFLCGIPGTVGGALAMNAGAYGKEIWDYVVQVKTIDREGVVHLRNASEYKVDYRKVFSPYEEWFVAAYFKLPFGNKDESLQKMKDMLIKRKTSQPLHLPNAGSVFKNPDNDYAARLIEYSGLKGTRIGGAEVSNIHSNFIVNNDKASASDIENLIDHVINVVRQKTGVFLEKEIIILGE